MGYTTEFEGVLSVSPAMSDETYQTLLDLQEKRNCVGESGWSYNQADRTGGKPDSLWCDWTPTEDRCGIKWNGTEKFYKYVEWLQYIITAHMVPNGHTVNGTLRYRGEEFSDVGLIIVENNVVRVKEAF